MLQFKFGVGGTQAKWLKRLQGAQNESVARNCITNCLRIRRMSYVFTDTFCVTFHVGVCINEYYFLTLIDYS